MPADKVPPFHRPDPLLKGFLLVMPPLFDGFLKILIILLEVFLYIFKLSLIFSVSQVYLSRQLFLYDRGLTRAGLPYGNVIYGDFDVICGLPDALYLLV